ncbi:MAG: TlpA family protein disulfide reductase [Pseudomonadales bacterium]|nr:TlpA family protein disulfide reductase [Pseudomonadales bacterium]
MRAWLLCGLVLLSSCARQGDFEDVRGGTHRFADYDGKWVVVNYWATWCGPCIKEIGELNALAREHAGRVVVLGVNFDEPAVQQGLEAANKMGIKFPVFAADPAARLGIDKPEVLPTTYLFAPGMKHVKTLVGPQTAQTILAQIDPGA